MKREFLLNFKVGEQELPKEAIDAIMEENGRDIEAAKTAATKPYADHEDIKKQLADANATIESLRAQQGDGTVDGKTAQQWKDAHDQLAADHQKELDGIKFQNVLDGAITAAKGRNAKAITALLDVETLRKSENQQEAINAALESLKKDSGYLFDGEGAPPPYAGGTGKPGQTSVQTDSLAGALRARYEK